MTINPISVPSLPAENASTLDPSMSWLVYNPVGSGKKLRRLLGSEFLSYLDNLYLRYTDDQGVANYVLATKADQTTGVKQLVAAGALSIVHTDSAITFTVTPGAVAPATSAVAGAVLVNTEAEVPPVVYRKAEVDSLNSAQNAVVSALTADHNTTKSNVTALQAINAGPRLTSLETYDGLLVSDIVSARARMGYGVGTWSSLTASNGNDIILSASPGDPASTSVDMPGMSVGANTIISFSTAGEYLVTYTVQATHSAGAGNRPASASIRTGIQNNGSGGYTAGGPTGGIGQTGGTNNILTLYATCWRHVTVPASESRQIRCLITAVGATEGSWTASVWAYVRRMDRWTMVSI
jgi:hypothetical protein